MVPGRIAAVVAGTVQEPALGLVLQVGQHDLLQDLLVDGGQLLDVPSTVVNVRGPEAVVEREGAISRAEIASALVETP